jgi:hypothetical protein
MAELKVTSVTNGEFDFGTVVWDTATEEYQRGSPQTFTITNVGDITATSIGDPILSNGIHFGYYNSVGPYSGGYPGTGGSCSASSFDLSPGQSCTVQIVAKPDAGPSGTEFAYFTMDYYSNGSHINGAQLLYLTQTPKIRGNFGFSPASGVVIPNSQTQTVTITNNGEANITNLSLTWSNLLSGGFTQTNNCGTTLAGGDSCTASITAGTGSHSAALILNFNDGINASAQTTFNFNTSP